MMKKRSERGFTHWVDGSSTWQLGVQGFFLQIRGILFQILIGVPLAGVPFWWPENYSYVLNIKLEYFIALTMFVFLTLATCGLIYLRLRTRRSLEIKSKLHRIVHDSRDCLSLLLKITKVRKGPKSKDSVQHCRTVVIDFSNQSCSNIVSYFTAMLNDRTIGCAIRLAFKHTEESGARQYITVGRAGELNPARSMTSEPVSSNQGIPNFFLSEGSPSGVLFFDDLKMAELHKAYFMTKNDITYKSDFKTMVVAPINGWNGEKNDLIGLLYITSKTDRIIDPKHVDMMKFSADHLALVYSSMFSRLEVSGAFSILGEE